MTFRLVILALVLGLGSAVSVATAFAGSSWGSADDGLLWTVSDDDDRNEA